MSPTNKNKGKWQPLDEERSGCSGIVSGASSDVTIAEHTRLIAGGTGLVADSAGFLYPSVQFNTFRMSQDAEDGPELFVSGDTAYTTRRPMNQEEFDKRFDYNRPERSQSALSQCANRCLRNYYEPCLSKRKFLDTIYGFVPILRWLPAYSWKSDLLNDVVGGLTVGVMHVPQGIAYAILAKVPPVVGLYTSFFPPLFYMLFGTSRHNSIGSFAVVSLMAGMTVGQMIKEEYNITDIEELAGIVPQSVIDGRSIVVSSTLALCVGLIQLAMGLLRLEILTTYFSDQLVAGFTTAASCHVFVAQLRDFFGIRSTRHYGPGNLFLNLSGIAASIPTTNLVTLGISSFTVIFLVFAKDFLSMFMKRKGVVIPLPFELIVVVFWTIISAYFDFFGYFGVRIVNSIPTGLPQTIMPDFKLLPFLIPRALSIAFVVMAVHISLAKMFAKKMSYKVDTGQELYALGFSASLSSFFTIYPVSCSLGRTMVNVEAGTKTQLSTVFSSVLLASIILYFGHYLKTLPMCVLAAIIIVALKGMTRKFKDLVTLWPLSKIDFSIWLVSFVATVAWDVTEGLAVSICYALLTTVFRTQWPRWHYLENLNGTNDFRDAERYRRVHSQSGICIFRFDSPLLFTNVDRFKENIHKAFQKWQKDYPRFLTARDLNEIPPLNKPKSHSHYKTLPITPTLSRVESIGTSVTNSPPSLRITITPDMDIHNHSNNGKEEHGQFIQEARLPNEKIVDSTAVASSSDNNRTTTVGNPNFVSNNMLSNDVERNKLKGALKKTSFNDEEKEDTKTRITLITDREDEDTISAVDHLNTVISTRSKTMEFVPTNKPMAGLLYRHFVIDCSGFTFVDYMGVNALKEIFQEMRNEKVLVYFAAAKAPVRDLFEKSGFYQYVPKQNFYPTIRDAVAIARKRRNASTLHLLEELSLPYDRLNDAISAQPMN